MAKFENYLALEASAGSGKTFNLAVRFIELVLKGEPINEILALTFTKKAAAEMKTRIVEKFQNLLIARDGVLVPSPELAQICEDLNMSADEVLAAQQRLLGKFLSERLNVFTFDAFFAKALRSFALNSGIDPGFENDESILGAQQREFLSAICKDGALLREVVGYVSSSAMSKDQFLNSLEAFWENDIEVSESGSLPAPDLGRVNEILSNLKSAAIAAGTSERSIKGLSCVGDLAGLSGYVLSALCNGSFDYNRSELKKIAHLDGELAELKSEIARQIARLNAMHLAKFRNLIKIYAAAKKRVQRKNGKLTFKDVANAVHSLLNPSSPALRENRELLYFRLDSKITHILIDEFQDTSVCQYEIMLPLIAEALAGVGARERCGSFFYVGDKKQSIYKFRGAKKEIFDVLKDEFPQIRTQSLPRNYRSLKLVVKFVNEIFRDKFEGYLDQQAANELSADLGEAALEKIKAYPLNNPSFELFTIEPDDYGYVGAFSYDDVLEGAADQARKLIRECGVSPSDIAILCWKNDHVNLLKDMLGADYEVSSGASKALECSEQVAAVIEYAKFCVGGDEIYLRNVEAILGRRPKKIKADLQKDAQKTAEFISEILELNYADADLLLFFETLAKFSSFSEYLFYGGENEAFSKEQSGIKIMSVHKSKGLQFPHVIICDNIGSKGTDRSKFITSYDYSAHRWKIFYKFKNREALDEEFNQVVQDRQRLECEEDINKLYVAFTRAERSLIIIKRTEEGINGHNYSYFSPYAKKGKDAGLLEWLDIADLQYGYVIPSPAETSEKPPRKEITLVAGEPQGAQEKASGGEAEALSAIYFGEALHYALEMSESFTADEILRGVSLARGRYAKFLNDADFENIATRALGLSKNEEFLALIKGTQAYKEMPIKSAEGELLRVDLACFGRDEILLFDYKSSEKYLAQNKAQVARYKSVTREFYPHARVRAFVLVLEAAGAKLIEVSEEG